MKIVIKVGTGVLTRENGTLDGSSIVHLVSVLATGKIIPFPAASIQGTLAGGRVPWNRDHLPDHP